MIAEEAMEVFKKAAKERQLERAEGKEPTRGTPVPLREPGLPREDALDEKWQDDVRDILKSYNASSRKPQAYRSVQEYVGRTVKKNREKDGRRRVAVVAISEATLWSGIVSKKPLSAEQSSSISPPTHQIRVLPFGKYHTDPRNKAKNQLLLTI